MDYVMEVDLLLHNHLRALLSALGEIDALLSLARVASQTNYIQPEYHAAETSNVSEEAGRSRTGSDRIDSDSQPEIVLRGARHPMAEKHLEKGTGVFVSFFLYWRCSWSVAMAISRLIVLFVCLFHRRSIVHF